MTHITPVVIFPPDGLDPVRETPRANIAGTLQEWCWPIQLWFDRQRRAFQDNRLIVSFGEVRVVSATEPVDMTQGNPWYAVRALLASHDYMFGENQGQEMTLAYLAGWKHPAYAGHAGGGLAVVGEAAWDFAARGDLSYALGLIAHEVAHLVWSMGHGDATRTPPDLLRPYPAPLEASVLYRQDGGQPRVLGVSGPVSCPAEPVL